MNRAVDFELDAELIDEVFRGYALKYRNRLYRRRIEPEDFVNQCWEALLSSWEGKEVTLMLEHEGFGLKGYLRKVASNVMAGHVMKIMALKREARMKVSSGEMVMVSQMPLVFVMNRFTDYGFLRGPMTLASIEFFAEEYVPDIPMGEGELSKIFTYRQFFFMLVDNSVRELVEVLKNKWGVVVTEQSVRNWKKKLMEDFILPGLAA